MSTPATVQDLSYPIGKFAYSSPFTNGQRAEALDAIELTPVKMRAALQGLTKQQIDTPYRPGGWTVRQVVHHVPDSHANAFIRPSSP